jgi:hypothetical protein
MVLCNSSAFCGLGEPLDGIVMFGLDLNKVTNNVFGKGGNTTKDEEDVVEYSKDEKPKEEAAESSESGDPPSGNDDDDEGGTEATTIAAAAAKEVEDEAPKTLKKKSSKQTTVDEEDEDGEPDKLKSLKKKGAKKKSITAASGDMNGEVPPKSPKKKIGKKKSVVAEDEEEASPKKPKKKSVKKKSMAKKVDDAARPEDDNNNDDENLEEEEEEDVMKLLDGMDIPDFDMSVDLDDDWKGEDELAESTDPKVKRPFEPESIDWKERLTRDEVFSKHYHPSREETLELNGMADHLGLAPSTGFFGMGKRMSMQIGMGAQVTEDMHALFYGGSSILLKHGPVQWEGKACALLLLTDGFVLTYSNFNANNILEKRYETCQLWTSVDFCETFNPMTFCIQLQKNGERYEFKPFEEEGDNVDTWMKALEGVLIHHAMHRATQFTETLGWQYQRIRRPAFTAAVTGNLDVLGELEPPTTINRLDSYNHYAPLHYAVLQETPNANVIQALLQAGADPNLADADGRSAMYYGTYLLYYCDGNACTYEHSIGAVCIISHGLTHIIFLLCLYVTRFDKQPNETS